MFAFDYYLVFIFSLIFYRIFADDDCDKGNQFTREGNLGQVAPFPWIGILKVHIHEGKLEKIAASVVVLVREAFAIINANEIVRIPKSVLKDDSKVMFILQENTPLFYKVKDFMVHPEFEILSYNTIALIQLHGSMESEEDAEISVNPICWPPLNLNTGNDLYLIGYTDENKLLEKEIFKMQFVEKEVCDEFYKRANFKTGELQMPLHYQCAFAVNKKEQCLWDNGMVVASNATGNWMLIGVTIEGPGCAAPVRFINLLSYKPWVITASTLDDRNINPERRRRKVA